MSINSAVEGMEYTIKDIDIDDKELVSFLLTLGCYKGEPIRVISHVSGSTIISIKDGKYSLDRELAKSITV